MRKPTAIRRTRIAGVGSCSSHATGGGPADTASLGFSRLRRAVRRVGNRFGARLGILAWLSLVPQTLKSVELAHPRQHDVDKDVSEVDEHPLAIARAFGAQRTESGFFGFSGDV